MNTDEYIKKWSEKLGIGEDKINVDYIKLLEEEKTIHKDSTEEEQQTRAIQRLAMIFKKQLRSPAVGFEGMIIGGGDLVDIVAKLRKEATDLFTENPQKAIADGVVDSNGIPLDTRKEWSTGNTNRGYGQPLPEHNYLRTIVGIAIKVGNGEKPKMFSMNVNGELAKNESFPIFKPITFRAIDRSNEDSETYTLNASMFTKFEEDTTLGLPKPMDLINEYCPNLKQTLQNLSDYHEKEKDNWNRLVILEGDVSTLILEPSSIGSRRIVIEDTEAMLEDLESQGITCWVPPRINIDFGEQSKILVIGRTSQGKKRDDNGNFIDEPGDIMINVFGLYAIPEFKIEAEVQELTEENTETTEEQQENKSETNW